MSRKRKPNQIEGRHISHLLEMRLSFAWKHLPDDGRRVLDVLECEHHAHGGAMNGRLPSTHKDFRSNGIRKQSVALAIRQCVELRFLVITQQGALARSCFTRPSLYFLTYLNGTEKSVQPTHAWRGIKSDEEALQALERAAAAKSEEHVKRAHRARLATLAQAA